MTSKQKQRLDPWGSADIENYKNLFEEFGIHPFDKFKDKLSDNRYIRRGIIFGHRDFERIMQCIEENKRFVMMTGLMPSGKFHLGHKMVADQIVWYQSLGAEIFLCSADLEAYAVRGMDLKTAREITINEYLRNYVAIGLTERNLTFWFQTDYVVPYYRLRDMLSKRATFNELRAIYGSLSPGKIFSVLTQSADILHPQLPEFGGVRPTVVPVGADQDPHLRLTRDLANRFQTEFKLILPSSTYHKFMRGLTGGKMSSSDPRSYIALTDDSKDVIKKIMNSKTGGRATVKEQKEKGGIPRECMVYDLFLYHLVDDDKELERIHRDCVSGNRICGECKAICADLMVDFLRKHQERMKKSGRIVEKILKK
ncbi:MAG TPA: tryptophan--tRNA ligase [Candidatus Altiarchaeales archaeon]|nr:tryptophan--tRNA ligase [Candidatus Altiarchaeales archaeon]